MTQIVDAEASKVWVVSIDSLTAGVLPDSRKFVLRSG